MLCELHLLRVCMAIQQGSITLAEVLQTDPAATH
jgi:hypothetical protein